MEFQYHNYLQYRCLISWSDEETTDDKVNIQGMFTVCIRSMFDNGQYIFRLKTNGQDCVKTPFGMFESDTMENDLKEFDKVVRDYYELDKIKKEDE